MEALGSLHTKGLLDMPRAKTRPNPRKAAGTPTAKLGSVDTSVGSTGSQLGFVEDYAKQAWELVFPLRSSSSEI